MVMTIGSCRPVPWNFGSEYAVASTVMFSAGPRRLSYNSSDACIHSDGKPGHLATLLPDHPIAAGLPKRWDVPQTEMYNEPFHVPEPDEVVFEEKWDLGEHFRSGCVWNVGRGKVFYFRPGHETYPVYRQPETLRVIENACRWLGQK